MNKNIQKFLRRPRPKPDEGITGFLVRVADENGYSRCDISPLFGFARIAQRDYVYGAADYSVLSQRIMISEDKLKDLAYKPVKVTSKQHIGTYELFGQEIFSYVLRYKTPTMCPDCLIEDPYQRKIWDLFPVTACPVHNRLLIEQCPDCGRKISFRRDRVCFCSCGCDFRNAKTEYAAENELLITRRIYQLCGLPPPHNNKPNLEAHLPKILMNLDLSGLLSALFLVTSQTPDGDILGKNLSNMNIPQIHRTLNSAAEIYENFPHNFFAFLDSLKNTIGRRISPPERHAGRRRTLIYRGIVRLITKVLSDEQFDEIRAALREFLNREKLASYKIFLDYSKTTAEEFYAAHITLHDLVIRMKTTKEVIKAMIKSGALRAYKGIMLDGKAIIYINLRDVENVEKRLPGVFSLKKAADVLDIYPHQINQLVDTGVIKLIEDIKLAPVYTRVVSKQAVRELYDKCRTAMLNNPAYEKNGEKIPATSVYHILGKARINCGELILMIINGEFAPAGCSGGGLNDFIYDKKQVMELYRRQADNYGQNALTTGEAYKLLKIKPLILRKLISQKYIFVSNERNSFRRPISKESLNKFNRDFIFSREIARKFSTSAEFVNKKLAAKNIFPVENKIDRYNWLYQRADVENIIIEKTDRREYTNKRRVANLHTFEETAAMLNISEEDLSLAIERKLISSFRHGKHSELKFSMDNIKSFRRLSLPHINYLRPAEASAIFGLTIKTFTTKYIDTKRIVPEARPYGNNNVLLFFSISELRDLKNFENERISAAEDRIILDSSKALTNRHTYDAIKPMAKN